MQFEDFDNKVRQAADQHHPNYDEKAWAKMQNLLEQHLPVKKDRDRRIIFLLLLFFLVGGGVWLIVSKPWQQGNTTISASKNLDKTPTNAPAAEPNGASGTAASSVPAENAKLSNAVPDQTEKDNPANAANGVTGKKTQLTVTNPDAANNDKGQSLTVSQTGKSNSPSPKQNKSAAVKNNKRNQSAVALAVTANTRKGNGIVWDNANVSSVQNNNTSSTINSSIAMTDKAQTHTGDASGNDETKVIEEKKNNDENVQPLAADKKKDVAKKSPGSKKSNYIFFSFSAGPDMSYISLSEPGEVKLLSGAGVGYSIKDRWFIRTGFYSGSKIYTANKYNYKPDNPGPTNNLEKIDADCKVYEVPLSVAYNFSKAEKHSFFGSMGLSSFFMKKEEYQYLYKYPGPPVTTYTHTKELYNENQHYFSVLTLSAGYGLRLNKTFSISAEPYIKLPLAGIGYGHVKLNSMGALFSVNVTPFRH
jgi:hypothetical protein